MPTPISHYKRFVISQNDPIKGKDKGDNGDDAEIKIQTFFKKQQNNQNKYLNLQHGYEQKENYKQTKEQASKGWLYK